MTATPPTILVCSENQTLARELVTSAKSALGGRPGTIAALVLSTSGVLPAVAGADTTYIATVGDLSAESGAAAVALAAEAASARLVLISATKLGLLTGPRVAERLDAGYAAWVTGVELAADALTVTARSTLYSGVAVATTTFRPGAVVLAVTPDTFEAATETRGEAAVVALDVIEPPSRLTVRSIRPKVAANQGLATAPAVIDVGQGFRAREDLALASSLAEVLGGQLGCSRPMASDRDWFPEWLGLSGLKVAPKLVVTLGISGAIQHMVGIRDARVIGAVNNDENAGIFSQADVGVVADLYDFVPALVDAIRSRGVTLADD
jgi:electron transfer flavoprotein alpha subunit